MSPARIAIGQYVPVESPVHRLNAMAKMGLLTAFTAALFLVHGFVGLAAAGVVLVGAVALSRVPAAAAARGIAAVSTIVAFTLLANGLRWRPVTALLRIGPLALDAEGLRTGAFFALRILLLVVATTLLTLTTSPVEITEALERLLRPLRPLGVPASELAMTLTIALRFVPTTAEETERIVTAQSMRGARLDSGGPVARVKAWVPVLIAVFFNLFRRADDLAVAMESRCYHGGEGRTSMRVSRMRPADWAALLSGAAMLIAMGVLL
jgi:energy-coupling factor transport system permease protein